MNMEPKIVALVVAVALVVVFLFIFKRLIRLALRLMLAGVMLLVIFGVAAVGWWNGWFEKPAPQKTQRAAPAKRTVAR
jgi:protein-S-isoprenylcysteine O-methyltransferase Ste14